MSINSTYIGLFGALGFGKYIALRVQVPNKNIILAQNLYYNYFFYPKSKYLVIGYLDPLGSLSDFGVQGAGFRYSALGGLESGVLGFRVGGLGMVEGLLGTWHEDRLEELQETSNLDPNFSTCHQAQTVSKAAQTPWSRSASQAAFWEECLFGSAAHPSPASSQGFRVWRLGLGPEVWALGLRELTFGIPLQHIRGSDHIVLHRCETSSQHHGHLAVLSGDGQHPVPP